MRQMPRLKIRTILHISLKFRLYGGCCNQNYSGFINFEHLTVKLYMKSVLVLFYIFIAIGCGRPESPTTFLLVRHAEKDNDGTEDPGLKTEGIARVSRLSKLLEQTQIDAFYSTNFKRTRQTVEPLASERTLPVQLYESFSVNEIEKMLSRHKGGTILICGHTDNIPWTANLLTGMQEYKDYEDSEYGILLIVSVVEKGTAAKVTRLDF